ncbi:hypothetical protein Afil01_58800 [Actinorhabdospora filicis]|uniref:RNA polymerase sigma factor (Sigma-70 family) n=1 Tax=Actinorhabdospora filicis TaxID=1785913 RepID=A0A9W6SS38_9ACTN|nr:sigma-70 family RNA polymerase sigma factor [Actinorhabdospora filicis]GLZ81073.1 hypothetical protein Afil01_58800 [Actinorhabdospora filicis]
MATAPHPGGEPPTDADSPPGDAELIIATRGGDTTAYGELYARHVGAAKRLARILARDGAEADDLVSETFAKMLTTLRSGRGPDLAFRAYLLTMLRNTFYDRVRRDKKVEYTDDLTRHDRGESFEDPAIAGLDRRYAARAFKRLPERWQMVLWHTEVEGESPKDVARLLGLSPNGVSALAYRARERLRQAFLQEHANDTADPECGWTAERLGARVRAGLSQRDSQKVDAHLESCTACKLLFVELGELNQSIPNVIAPIFLGTAAVPYLLSLAGKVAVGAGVAGLYAQFVKWSVTILNRIREFFQSPAGKWSAAGGGTVAVAAAVLAFLLLANDAPPPPPSATPANPAAPAPNPPAEPPNDPAEPPPNPPGPDPSSPGASPSSPAPAPSPSAKDFAIFTPEIGNDLVAGSDGTLPITIRSPERADVAVADDTGGQGGWFRAASAEAEDVVTLVAAVPEGVGLASRDAGDGWSCAVTEQGGTTAGIRCTHPALRPGGSTTARLRLDVPRQVSGFQTVKVTVDTRDRRGEAELRVAIAPQGMTTAFASVTASGVATTGNTLLTCKHRPECLQGPALDNHTRRMVPWTGEDPDLASSGAKLTLPGGARVVWAGLYWTASARSVPREVVLSGPGGKHRIGAERTWSGSERTVTQAGAEVTDLIRGGTWTVSAEADQLPYGITNYAGWSIVVAYDTGPDREVAVYEGLSQPRGGSALDLQIRHKGRIQVGMVLWDGDRCLTGDTATVGDRVIGTPGNLGQSRTPGSGEDHTFGVDAVTYDIDVPADENRLRIVTGWDPIDIGVIATAA